MAGYTKIFGSLLHSTVWQASATTRLVWITMLVLADRDGLVEASVPGLARAANVSLEECEAALWAFLAPDKYSRTPDHDGRRIEEVRGGWRLLNFEYYRDLKSAEQVREQDAERQRRKREREAAEKAAREAEASRSVTVRHGESEPVTSITKSPPSDHAQAQTTDPDLSPPSPSRVLGSASDRVGARSEVRAEPNWFRLKMGFDATDAFRAVFKRYPNQHGLFGAASAWQAIVEAGFPGGEPALAAAITARFDAGQLTRHPYAGEHRYRPKFETYLKEFSWEDAESAPDDAVGGSRTEKFVAGARDWEPPRKATGHV